jgi:hypothetical protein
MRTTTNPLGTSTTTTAGELTTIFRRTRTADWTDVLLEAVNGSPVVGHLTYLARHDDHIEVNVTIGGVPVQFWVPATTLLTYFAA